MALELAHETIWFDKWRVDDAEKQFYENKSLLAIGSSCTRGRLSDGASKGSSGLGSLASQIAKARQEIQNSLVSGGRPGGGGAPASADVLNRITRLEDHNTTLLKTVSTLESKLAEVTKRLASLECGGKTTTAAASPKTPEPMEDDDDDDVDLFGSSDEEDDAEAARVREERLKAYAEKKSKKPGPIAKSSVLLDCKPWDDETDMAVMEKEIRKIEMDGLVWGAGKLVPLAFGIMKLSILCIVEDAKVSIDDLSEKIEEMEDYVQSVDIGAFNKI